MSTTETRLEEIYQQFKTLTNPRLVRSGHRGDAFALLAFEILFRKIHEVRELNIDNDLELLEKSVVLPPDDGVDIFFQDSTMIEEPEFHVVQCKNTALAPEQIRECIIKMRDSLKLYVENGACKKNLKRVLFENDFGKESLPSCIYYVVHQGNVDSIPNQRTNEKIITAGMLQDYSDLLIAESVPFEAFESDALNNFIINNFADRPDAVINPNVPKSILCNLSGYDLACLDKKYSRSDLGRNILYGGNLRDSLGKTKSKTYSKMVKTIKEEPDLFLYYNNGVTIIAEEFDRRKEDNALVLKRFSIINGAQTTSTLGAFLVEAEQNNDLNSIEKLKKVLVLTKIYEVSAETPNHKTVSERIRIYSNTQTPLSSRDMVSINDEQIRLQDRFFLNSSPQIYINIKSGAIMPKPSNTPKHGQISNEALAQLGLCAFYFEPNTVLGKKQQIFEPSGKEDDGFLLNEIYDKLFSPERGIFFKLSSWDLDELLFVKRLHDDTKLLQKKVLNEQKAHLSSTPLPDGMSNEQRNSHVESIKRSLEISQKCFYFNVAAYYTLRNRFDPYCQNINNMSFDSSRYYEDKKFKDEMILAFAELIFSRTIQIIQDNLSGENVYTWLRRDEFEDLFFSKLQESFTRNLGLADSYKDFVGKFKKVRG